MMSGHIGRWSLALPFGRSANRQVCPLIQRQYLHGSQSTFTKWIMKKGAVCHCITTPTSRSRGLTQGEAQNYSQGKKYVMHAGDIMIIPPPQRST